MISLDEEDPNFGECFTTAMQDFASQESKLAVEKDRESRWISREDRLPEGKDANRLGEVISLDDKGIPTTIHFNNVIMFDQYTHWQSLPLPPEK